MEKRPNLLFFAVRDAGIIVATLALWAALSNLSAARTATGDLAGVVLGAALALCIHLLHEWGHMLGGLVCGSKLQAGESFSTLSLFAFDTRNNSVAQFAVMSLAGFAMTALSLVLVFTLLPDGYLASHIARGYAVLQVILALVLEVPIFIWALVSGRIPPIDYRLSLQSLVPAALTRGHARHGSDLQGE